MGVRVWQRGVCGSLRVFNLAVSKHRDQRRIEGAAGEIGGDRKGDVLRGQVSCVLNAL